MFLVPQQRNVMPAHSPAITRGGCFKRRFQCLKSKWVPQSDPLANNRSREKGGLILFSSFVLH